MGFVCQWVVVFILGLCLLCNGGCVFLAMGLMERKARAEEERTGVKREYRVVEPWEVNPGS